jgi:hypothetical protein
MQRSEDLVAAVNHISPDVDPRTIIQLDPFEPIQVLDLGTLCAEDAALPRGRRCNRKARDPRLRNRTYVRK